MRPKERTDRHTNPHTGQGAATSKALSDRGLALPLPPAHVAETPVLSTNAQARERQRGPALEGHDGGRASLKSGERAQRHGEGPCKSPQDPETL